ncbi:hypothetical protein B0T24DRAFT_565994 [Lasiosphaeria ovina]|uniref:Uncharacterized protein n=1 Tax=Lasiosphaeria ovina TaxID=92902 RepID=A0AAE0NKQ1_9PEZI|nr:hypothetical protein B0T24DRAFT_565994 [Lasiosphaeria ovina]
MSPEAREGVLRLLFLLFVSGLMVLILYYESTSLDTAFEAFMDSQKFGVRLLFTAFGVLISTVWEYYFLRKVSLSLSISPYRSRLSSRDMLFAPATTAFSGLARSIAGRQGMSGAIALAAVLSKFLPIMLSTVPFRNIITWGIHETGTWMAVGALAYMAVVLAASFALPVVSAKRGRRRRAVRLPVEPNSIAGCLYYVCDSRMVVQAGDFEGLSTMGGTRRDRLMRQMNRDYLFGDMVGVSGAARIGIDRVKEDPDGLL